MISTTKEEMADETLLLPDEVMVGRRDRYIAHRKYNDHLVRAVFEYKNELPAHISPSVNPIMYSAMYIAWEI